MTDLTKNAARFQGTDARGPLHSLRQGLLAVLAVAVFALVGCDGGTGNLTGSSGEAAQQEASSQEQVSLESPAELHARLPEIGTRLEGTQARQWLAEERTAQIQGSAAGDLASAKDADQVLTSPKVAPSEVFLALSEDPAPRTKTSSTSDDASASKRTNGPFERSPRAFGLGANVQMPEPAASGTSSKTSVSGSGGTKKSTDIGTNALPLPCYQTYDCGGGGGGGGGGSDDPPSFFGTSSLYFDDVLKEGWASWEAVTETENNTYVDEVSATTQTDVNVSNGAYQETTPPYTFTKSFANEASALSSQYHYAGNVDYGASGKHSITDGGDPQPEKTSSAGASTNFSASSCAPFVLQEGGSVPEDGNVSLEWQTICPQKNKVLQIKRTSGPGGTTSSAEVETSGDGWFISAFEAWNGIFLNNGTYEWTIRASGENSTRSGTFSVSKNNLCRPSLDVVSYTLPTVNQNGSLTVSIPGCSVQGKYRLTVWGTELDGRSVILYDKLFEYTGGSGDPSFSVQLESPGFGGSIASIDVYLDKVSDYNGSARLDSETGLD